MLNLVHRRKGHAQGDYQLLNGSVVARRINVTRFIFSHFSQTITPYHTCEPSHTYPATSVSNTTRLAHFFPLVCGLFVSFCTYTPLFKQPAKCLNSKILERPEQKSNRPTGLCNILVQMLLLICQHLSAPPSRPTCKWEPSKSHAREVKGHHLTF